MKIVISGSYGYGDLGDEAILDCMIRRLREEIPGVEIFVLSSNPEDTFYRHKVKSYYSFAGLQMELRKLFLKIAEHLLFANIFNSSILSFCSDKKFKQTIKILSSSDLVISGGGGYLNEFFITDITARFLELYIAHLLGKPFVIYAQTIGPFFTQKMRILANFVFQNAALITVRDKVSANFLKEIGVKRVPIIVTTDEAVLTSSADSHRIDTIMEHEKVETSFPLIAIAPRYWMGSKLRRAYEQKPRIRNVYQTYRSVLARVADHLIEELGAHIIFIPFHIYKPGSKKDDRIIAKEIFSTMKHQHNATVITGDYSPSETMGLVQKAEMMIGTRFHSIVFAICSYRPAIGISYWFKIDEFMRELELADYVCDIDDLEEDIILDKAIKAWAYREDISCKLKNKAIELKSRALLNATYVANFVRSLV